MVVPAQEQSTVSVFLSAGHIFLFIYFYIYMLSWQWEYNAGEEIIVVQCWEVVGDRRLVKVQGHTMFSNNNVH